MLAASLRLRQCRQRLGAVGLQAASWRRAAAAMRAAVEQGSDLLPHQGILDSFVHHNPLRHYEHLSFDSAQAELGRAEAYRSPGARALALSGFDPRKRAHEALVELCSVFLDRGGAKWGPSFRDVGFLPFFARLEGLGMAPWRSEARAAAQRLQAEISRGPAPSAPEYEEFIRGIAERELEESMRAYGAREEEWADTLRSTMLELRGWADMFHTMESVRQQAPHGVPVRLVEFCAVQNILLRSSLLSLPPTTLWGRREDLRSWLSRAPPVQPNAVHEDPGERTHGSVVAYMDQDSERRQSLEEEFEQRLVFQISRTKPHRATSGPPALQLFACIDDREGSFRRHVEATAGRGKAETFGIAGFFGLPVSYRALDGGEEAMELAPEGAEQCPDLFEVESRDKPEENCALSERYARRRRAAATAAQLAEQASFSPPLALPLTTALLPVSMARLALMGFAPLTLASINERAGRMFLQRPPTQLVSPFEPSEAASLLAKTLGDLGIIERFAPLVLVLGHGASSANNPFAAAYNCGACGGRAGGPNARLLAALANDADVRSALKKDHDIAIPEGTVFVGGEHNTTTDDVKFYDTEHLSTAQRLGFEKAKIVVERASAANALERCSRFLLAGDVHSASDALRHVRTRAVDAAEVRPELNHATNAAVVIGRRWLTDRLFLDRRIFLPSYDPAFDDEEGTNLEHVLAPALNVCSGINLEYLFSTIDSDHHGAGTKAPLNVVGNIGVIQGTAGDIRVGLPTQMTEFHIPLRALFIVDAPVARVEAVLARRKELGNLVHNGWLRMLVREPDTGEFFRYEDGRYVPVDAQYAPHDDHHGPIRHLRHGLNVVHKEDLAYKGGLLAMLGAAAGPIAAFGPTAMNPHGVAAAVAATSLSLPLLAFSRRYLHGEHIFARTAMLTSGLLLGFNLVATAPSLEMALAGWSLFGFSSTFLIGSYNDRPTVRNNATFAFAAYRLSDFALLTAAALEAHGDYGGGVAAALLTGAVLKSSQFPLTSLFARSMEGPTPASALGYAGLSAHLGVVLLAGTLPLWFDYDLARAALAGVGLFTAGHSTLLANIRSDRKGSIAHATAASIGLIFATLAAGYTDAALLMSLGHASYRMVQTLRAPSIIDDTSKLSRSLDKVPWPRMVSDRTFEFCWRLRRFETDFHLLNVLNRVAAVVETRQWRLTKLQQRTATAAGVVLAGLPFTPLSHGLDEALLELIPTHPVLAGGIMAGHFAASVLTMRLLFAKVLRKNRFKSAWALDKDKP